MAAVDGWQCADQQVRWGGCVRADFKGEPQVNRAGVPIWVCEVEGKKPEYGVLKRVWGDIRLAAHEAPSFAEGAQVWLRGFGIRTRQNGGSLVLECEAVEAADAPAAKVAQPAGDAGAGAQKTGGGR